MTSPTSMLSQWTTVAPSEPSRLRPSGEAIRQPCGSRARAVWRRPIEGLGAGDKLCGGDGVDVIKGGGGADNVDGGGGNDDIYGGAGGDTLDGGAAFDSIRGDDGADRCTSGEARKSSCALIY